MRFTMRGIFRIVLACWMALWILFTVRPLIKDSRFAQYCELFGKPLNERRAIVYGRPLYKYLENLKAFIPEGARYALTGLTDGSIDSVRADYYLYPRLRTADPEFLRNAKRFEFSFFNK